MPKMKRSLIAMFGFLFLLFFDRDKLQSEDYQIRKRSLEMMQQKGEDAIPAIAVRSIEDPSRGQTINVDGDEL